MVFVWWLESLLLVHAYLDDKHGYRVLGDGWVEGMAELIVRFQHKKLAVRVVVLPVSAM